MPGAQPCGTVTGIVMPFTWTWKTDPIVSPGGIGTSTTLCGAAGGMTAGCGWSETAAGGMTGAGCGWSETAGGGGTATASTAPGGHPAGTVTEISWPFALT